LPYGNDLRLVRQPEPNGSVSTLSLGTGPDYTKGMEMNQVSTHERLAYSWAVASSVSTRSSQVSDRLLQRCRESTYRLSEVEALDLLADIPALVVV
jgi:hypothetical protein